MWLAITTALNYYNYCTYVAISRKNALVSVPTYVCTRTYLLAI